MSQRPFAVLYRWRIDPAHEDAFRQRWRAATIELRDQFGALGSCLTRDAGGNFVAFARWPTEEHRDKAFAARTPADPAPGVLEFEQTKLWVEDDLLSK
jgi:heme-degrading monooxygenase HmoA